MSERVKIVALIIFIIIMLFFLVSGINKLIHPRYTFVIKPEYFDYESGNEIFLIPAEGDGYIQKPPAPTPFLKEPPDIFSSEKL